MAAMIRNAGKAYSVFDAARLVLASGDRFHVKFTLPADSALKFNVIPADGSVWMSKEEAISNFLNGEGLNEFYRMEEVEMEEPKGNFTSVAVCGMSGEILGPASHHSYQPALHKIHRERFANMSFEDYKRRVRSDNTPETIQKWKDSQKRGVQWVYLNPQLPEGEEPLRLKSRSEMESHFRKTHAETLVHETHERIVSGNISKKLLNPSLYIHLRRAVDDARKHLLATAQLLCVGFESNGLKLFKRRGGKLWVSRNRPRAMDSGIILSDRINRIIELAKAQPGITTKQLIETLSPSPPAAEAPEVAPPAPAPVVQEEPAAPTVAESTPTEEIAEPTVESTVVAEVAEDSQEAPVEDAATPVTEAAEPAEAVASPAPPAAVAAPVTPVPPSLSDAQLQVLKDLHWLNSEGYLIEYSDGVIFPGVTEPPPAKPKVVRPAPAAKEQPATKEVAVEAGAMAEEIVVAEETVEMQTSKPVEATDVEASKEVGKAHAPAASGPIEEAAE
jgi:hypothetical protein